MRSLFIDTSAFYALFNEGDPHHKEAITLYQQGPLILVTTQAVFTELLSLLTKRQGKSLAIRVGKELRAAQDRLRILSLDDSQIERAWQIFCRFKDKDYDLVDCMSFICMEDEGLNEAFAYDHHFRQYGFQMVTPSS